MNRMDYPELDETLYRETLSNGLTIAVVPRKGFTKKLAYFVADYGSIHTDLCSRERRTMLLPALPIIWSIRCLICPAAGMCPPSLPPWAP